MKFNTATTGSSYYDQMYCNEDVAERLGFELTLPHMSPREYVEACAQGFDESVVALYNDRAKNDKIDRYMEMMEKGDLFPVPLLHYAEAGFSQEGLHRAFAAGQLGIDSMPVVIARELPTPTQENVIATAKTPAKTFKSTVPRH